MFRLLNAACQVCAYSLDLQSYSKEFMFGTSWAVRTLPRIRQPFTKTYINLVCCRRPDLRSTYHQILDERHQHDCSRRHRGCRSRSRWLIDQSAIRWFNWFGFQDCNWEGMIGRCRMQHALRRQYFGGRMEVAMTKPLNAWLVVLAIAYFLHVFGNRDSC